MSADAATTAAASASPYLGGRAQAATSTTTTIKVYNLMTDKTAARLNMSAPDIKTMQLQCLQLEPHIRLAQVSPPVWSLSAALKLRTHWT